MKLRDHLIIGGVASVALAPLIGSQAALFGGASVLIDVDHYMHFLYRNRFRDWSVRRMFAFYQSLWERRHRDDLLSLEVFHTLEWAVLLALAAAWTGWTAIWVVLAGVLFHVELDRLYLRHHGVLNRRAHSVIDYFVRRRRLQHAGRDPALPFIDALAAIRPNWHAEMDR